VFGIARNPQTAESLDLKGRIRIEVRASSHRSVRGVTLLAAVVDELAFLRDETSAVPDIELVRALRPALVTTGGLLLGISSPWAKRGVLWQQYRRHYGVEDAATLISSPYGWLRGGSGQARGPRGVSTPRAGPPPCSASGTPPGSPIRSSAGARSSGCAQYL